MSRFRSLAQRLRDLEAGSGSENLRRLVLGLPAPTATEKERAEVERLREMLAEMRARSNMPQENP